VKRGDATRLTTIWAGRSEGGREGLAGVHGVEEDEGGSYESINGHTGQPSTQKKTADAREGRSTYPSLTRSSLENPAGKARTCSGSTRGRKSL
jgi:hypothetical protein